MKNGVVQDKLFLPGLRKLKHLIKSGFFEKILSVRGEFGYWVFEGDWQIAQRPSWNYRSEAGGGIILDMFCHWRYVLDNLFGPTQSVCAIGANHIAERRTKRVIVTMQQPTTPPTQSFSSKTESLRKSIPLGAFGSIAMSSSATGRRDKGQRRCRAASCKVQHRVNTPKPVWNPDLVSPTTFLATGKRSRKTKPTKMDSKCSGKNFCVMLLTGAPFPYTLLEGAKGVQLAEAGLKSWRNDVGWTWSR